MKKALIILIFLSLFKWQIQASNDSTKIITPEGIGKHLSELLIHRVDIKQSPVAIDINRLFPDQDFKEFEITLGLDEEMLKKIMD